MNLLKKAVKLFCISVFWLLVIALIWVLTQNVKITPMEALKSLNEAYGYQVTIVAIIGGMLSFYYTVRAVIFKDVPSTLLASHYYPHCERKDIGKKLEDGLWRLRPQPTFKGSLTQVWNYWISTLLLFRAKKISKYNPIPGILVWKKPKKLTGWRKIWLISFFIKLYRAITLQPGDVFSSLITRLRIEQSGEHYDEALHWSWNFAETHMEHIPEGKERPERWQDEDFYLILAYDFKKSGYTSLATLIVAEIFVDVMHSIIDKDGDLLITIDEKFSDGKDHAWLFQKAINAIRLQETNPEVTVCRKMV